MFWMKFPAPPAETKAITLSVDKLSPFDDLAIQDVMRAPALLLGALAVLSTAHAASCDDPWSAATAAVTALGANIGVNVVPTVREVSAHARYHRGRQRRGFGHARGAAQDQQPRSRQARSRRERNRTRSARRAAGRRAVRFRQADIRADAANSLAQLATVIRAYKGAVRLEGHTDAKGAADYNQKLSERRAQSVKLWLATREQIPAARMHTQGFGKTRPIAGNDTDAGRQKNRRVEAVIGKR